MDIEIEIGNRNSVAVAVAIALAVVILKINANQIDEKAFCIKILKNKKKDHIFFWKKYTDKKIPKFPLCREYD